MNNDAKEAKLWLYVVDLIPEYFAKLGIKARIVPAQEKTSTIFFKTDIGNGAIRMSDVDLSGSVEKAEDQVKNELLPKIIEIMRNSK